jgi:hypothetical protein
MKSKRTLKDRLIDALLNVGMVVPWAAAIMFFVGVRDTALLQGVIYTAFGVGALGMLIQAPLSVFAIAGGCLMIFGIVGCILEPSGITMALTSIGMLMFSLCCWIVWKKERQEGQQPLSPAVDNTKSPL